MEDCLLHMESKTLARSREDRGFVGSTGGPNDFTDSSGSPATDSASKPYINLEGRFLIHSRHFSMRLFIRSANSCDTESKSCLSSSEEIGLKPFLPLFPRWYFLQNSSVMRPILSSISLRAAVTSQLSVRSPCDLSVSSLRAEA